MSRESSRDSQCADQREERLECSLPLRGEGRCEIVLDLWAAVAFRRMWPGVKTYLIVLFYRLALRGFRHFHRQHFTDPAFVLSAMGTPHSL